MCHEHCLGTQKSPHLQKNHVTERHNRGTKRKLKSHQAQKKALRAFLGRGVRLQFSLCAPIVPLRDATFLQMTRLLQVTSTLSTFHGSASTQKSNARRGASSIGIGMRRCARFARVTQVNFLLLRTRYKKPFRGVDKLRGTA